MLSIKYFQLQKKDKQTVNLNQILLSKREFTDFPLIKMDFKKAVSLKKKTEGRSVFITLG